MKEKIGFNYEFKEIELISKLGLKGKSIKSISQSRDVVYIRTA